MSIKVTKNNKSNWLRPWNVEKFDNLYNRDERFFAILVKGLMSWMNNNILMYNKPINHFIFNTGSSYFYVESNGYEFSMNETSGEDAMYMKMPRCVIEIGDISIPMEELSAPYVRGVYERLDGNEIKGYNAQMQRMPIELTVNAKYVLSNFNESIILIEELINKVAFQQYFRITYLGQIIDCSLEIDSNYKIDFNKIDMTSTDTTQKTIELTFKVCSNYPIIDESTEIENSRIIESLSLNTNLFNGKISNRVDSETVDNIVNTDYINNFKTKDELGNPISAVATIKKKNDESYADTHILEYDDDELVKTTFGELKNKI